MLTVEKNETQSKPAAPRVKGQLDLNFEYDNASQQTRLRIRRQQPPLRMVRAFEQGVGGLLVHLHNVSGGVLGGDQMELRLEIGAGAQAQVTSVGATRLYRSRSPQLIASQLTEVKVGEGGLLEFLAEPIIPFAGSRYRQQTRIELAPGAGLFWWEIVAPGREAKGEVFEYDLFQSHLDITGAGKPLVLERIRLEPQLQLLTSPARLGHYRYFASFYICKVGLDAANWRNLESELSELALNLSRPGESLWGVSTLPAHGLLVRALCCRGREINPGLLAFWQAAKRTLYNQEAVLPRKIY